MWQVIVAVVATLVGTATIGGIAIRYGLLPYFKSQLIDPILTDLGAVLQAANAAVAQVNVIAQAWGGHLDWSQNEVEKNQREVDRIWAHMLRDERIAQRRRHEL